MSKGCHREQTELGKMLLVVGIALVIGGAFLVSGTKLPFRLGRLPGDIVYKGQNRQLLFSDRYLHPDQRGAELSCRGS